MTGACYSSFLTSALLLLGPALAGAQTPSANPTVETVPVPSGGDAADDSAIWVHPGDDSLSLVIGTDKQSGLLVYDLAGNRLQYLPDGRLNNVDLRGGFELSGQRVTLVTSGERDQDLLMIYAVDPVSRSLNPVAARDIALGTEVYGCCMYVSPLSGEYYFFCNTEDDGLVQQWRLFEASGGKVDAELVRSFDAGTQCEGCVADDENAYFFLGEEGEGIWRYGAEPGAGSARVSVDTTGAGGHLEADVEGLALYLAPGGEGYLVASSQGDNSFAVYERRPPHEHRLSFQVGANAALSIDAVSETDGIDLTSHGLGSAFPRGLFVAQDGSNQGGNQNFKYVAWEAIAVLADPPLIGADSAAAPKAAFAASASDTDPLEITFTDQSTGEVTSWVWDFGDRTSSVDQHPVHLYAQAGNYTVRLTVEGPGGSDSAEQIIQVEEDPADAPTAAFQTSASATNPLEIAFTDQSTGEVTSWVWDFGDLATSNEESPVHAYDEPGSYTVVLTVTGPGGSDATQQVIEVEEDPTGGGGGAGGGGSGGSGCGGTIGRDGRPGSDASLALWLAAALLAAALRARSLAARPRLPALPG